MLKQVFATFVLFNAYNVAFSAGIHYGYADRYSQNFWLNTAIMAVAVLATLLTTVAMEVTSKDGYG